MTAIGLPAEDVAEVRRAVLQWACEHGISYDEIAKRAHLQPHDVKNFLACRSGSERIVAHLLAYLPLHLVYQRPRVAPR